MTSYAHLHDAHARAVARRNDQHIQPYAQAYLAAHPGRAFVGHEFIVWMHGQWREWAALSGVDLGRSLSASQRAAFGVWLADQWLPTEGAA